MRVWLSICAALALLGGTACSKNDSSNPSTSNLEDLNPPSGVVTVAHHNSLEVQWQAANAEDDFKGYDVFVMKGALSTLPAPTFPSAAKDLTKSVPRCVGNTKIFEAFGFPASTDDCSGDPATSDGAAATTTTTSSLMDDSTTTTDTDPDDKPISTMTICDGNTDTTISLPGTASPPTLGMQTCKFSNFVDSKGNKTALVDGQQYTVFVVAVKGDAKDSISWASNFVEETPVLTVYDGSGATGASNAAFTLAAGKFTVLPIAKIIAAATATTDTTIKDSDLATDDCTSDAKLCTINDQNDGAANSSGDGIYFGRLGTGSYPERVFISTASSTSGGIVGIQGRGPRGYDPTSGVISPALPDDSASTGTYVTDGTLFPLSGNQVFDLQIVKDATAKTYYYAKVVIGQPKLATDTDATSLMTIPVSVVIDPTVGDTDY